MLTEEQVRHAFDTISSSGEPLEWKGDTFKYGYLVGKMIALEWVLDGKGSHDISCHYDFEDWSLEAKRQLDDLRSALRENPPPDADAAT